MEIDKYYIGVDLGGTNIHSAAVSNWGEVLARKKIETRVSEGYASVVGRIVSSITSISGKVGREPAGVGLASAGAISAQKGVITQSTNFPDWHNAPLGQDVSSVLGLPVILENDASSAAIGEMWKGAAREWDNFAMFTLGTGVGGGLVLNKKLWHGSNGMAGEIGHINVEPGGRKCGCGANGCLETYASATGVMQTAKDFFNLSSAKWLRDQVDGDVGKVTSELITAGAEDHDEFCVGLLNDVGMYIGRAMAQVIMLLDISNFVIGGGMAPALPLMKPAIRKEALQYAYTLTQSKLIVKQAAQGNDAGILGVVKLMIRESSRKER